MPNVQGVLAGAAAAEAHFVSQVDSVKEAKGVNIDQRKTPQTEMCPR